MNDINALPEKFDINEWQNKMLNEGMLPMDPTMSMTRSVNVNDGLYTQIIKDPYETKFTELDLQIANLYLQNKLLTLKILVLEGVFTKEEANNIKNMLMSCDEASITLADTLIENA